MNLPNILTISRIIVIPFFVIAFYLPVEWSNVLCAWLFMAAAVTDWFDGYLARKLNQMTPFGAFLDPVADKLMVAISLTVVIEDYQSVWVTAPAMIIIGREIVVSALREWMAEQGKRENVAVSYVGKVKTVAQMWSIFFLLLTERTDWMYDAGMWLMYIAAALTLWSMVKYLSASWSHLFSDNG